MQTIIQVQCKPVSSLRAAIFNTKADVLKDCRLKLSDKKKGKNKWLSLCSTLTTIKGAIKIKWDANTNLLTARVVNRSKTIPDKIIGDFTTFLLWQYGKSIISLNITTSNK
jgi:hypothetical protein